MANNLFFLQPALRALCSIVCLTDNCPLPQEHTFAQEILIKRLKLCFFMTEPEVVHVDSQIPPLFSCIKISLEVVSPLASISK